MSTFLFPDVGEGIHEGKLVSWKVKEGMTVKQDEVLCSVETDKAIVEIPSPHAAMIQKLYHKEGDVIKVGEPLVTFQDITGGAAPMGVAAPPKAPPLPSAPAADVRNVQGPVPVVGTHALASPSTRKLAREKGVDINAIKGTGQHGRITATDVAAASSGGPAPARASSVPSVSPQEYAQSAPQSPPLASGPLPAGVLQTIPYAGMRKAIGDHMQIANSIPAVALFAEADVSAVVALREHLKVRAEHEGVKLTYLPIFLKALCAALKAHPILNSRLGSDGISVFKDIHLGIAVETDRGLVVPVVRDVLKKNALEVGKEINALVEAARAGKLTREQMSGSTFSVSSIGPMRVEAFTPMINAPEAAILGIGGIQEKPWAKNGRIVIEKVVTFSLVFDHRILDGAEAARFLTDLVNLVEDPELLILEGI